MMTKKVDGTRDLQSEWNHSGIFIVSVNSFNDLNAIPFHLYWIRALAMTDFQIPLSV